MGRKRKNGEGTVRLRKDGRWEGRVVVGYDENGLPKTKNVLAKTKSECVEKLAPSDFQQFYAWMKKAARTRWCANDTSDGLSDNMLLGCHSLCRRALEKAVDEGLISRNPTSGCKLPTAGYNEMKILSREEMQRVLIQAKEEGYYEIFLLEFATGLQLGELMALQWDDLNMTTGELQINKQVSLVKDELVISEPKTKTSIRTLLIPPSVMKVMRAYRAKTDSCWMFPSLKKEDAPIGPSVISHRLQKILKHAGCRPVRFRNLRHTFATNALEYGMDIKTLSTILGHVSSATTLNVYSHITDEMRRSAAAKIDQGIAKAEPKPQDETIPKERTMTTFQAKNGGREK